MYEDWKNFVNDSLDDCVASKVEDAFGKGQEDVYLKMILNSIDPRRIGCSEELFQKLYRQVQQMNK